jgi:hypothetical protein
MKKWFVLLFILVAVRGEAMLPLRQAKVPLRTDVKVKRSRAQRKKNEYSGEGFRTSVQKNTEQNTFLAIEVQNMSPKVIKDIKILCRFYRLQFERSTGTRMVLTRRMGDTERLVASGMEHLSIAQLDPLEKKVVESESLETSYRATQDTTKLISRTNTTGTKFGGYIVEYFVGDELVKRDASSRSLHEAYLKSLRRPGTPTPLRMNIRR